ncbi:diacylglycerol kinase [Citromicrobium sp. RCC1885]|uniref:dihydrofolate reductase n=1 Tax=unclassified Citromicrobium TaxID=2630544 RepID=UPI0006C8FC15|nr:MULTISPECIES: dihydrofolate reductase [unclassified Citromicrobium]KPM21341.1 diacylglycerol kinase [Citromicrobium sp. RCC1885]KPM29421.1 diacylglycerol kinase [Citromicrobium sp. RCC1878]MAO03521.1 dihydrofolate reductase [Citromicrobium sp.]OAM06689.1 diacylglycerol kinase [Citromicrobium sp. RCC1897]
MIQDQLFLVYARAANGMIGKDGGLPWHIPADLKHFKKVTMGKPMIMGRKTFESFPAPLPGRRHIVLSRDSDWQAEGAEHVMSVPEALAAAGGEETAIIGGSDVFLLFEPQAERIELTQIHADYDGDTFMDAPDPERWAEVAREDHEASGDTPAFSFITYERRA